MSARKTLNTVMRQLNLLGKIYKDMKLTEDYFEKLNHLKYRIFKLPKMAEKKPELLPDELDWVVNKTNELFEEVDPNLLRKYKIEYDTKPFGGDEGKLNQDEDKL
jgi:hypothetical protein